MAVDVPRPDLPLARRRRRLLVAGSVTAAFVLMAVGIARLQPSARRVARSTVWIDTVRRGEMLRQVRGLGTLVPEEIRWIPAQSEARVERILVQPGSAVAPDTVVIELVNPELALRASEAQSQLRAAEAQLAELRVRLQSQRLDQEAAAARVQSEARQARMRADADDTLAREGLVGELTSRLSRVAADELTARSGIEERRLAIGEEAVQAQLAVQQAEVEQRRALADLRRSQADALRVRAGIAGVLQLVGVEVGQQVVPGTNLARVAQPDRLKAVIRVPETQARDLAIGLPARVDTRNGIVAGHVRRIDPAVQNGTVTVDITLADALPKGARPDLSVDGTVELERLADVVFVGRPAQGQPEGRASLFRLEPDGVHAGRVAVELGRASVATVEVRRGLAPGDQVILSDGSAWGGADRIRLE